jgi:predicted ATP-dependent endonuclease of OLD family
MKVAKVEIENFRHIEHLELDFTDSVGRVRDVSLIVGPNTSGKTTVLDAIALGLGVLTELTSYRHLDLVLRSCKKLTFDFTDIEPSLALIERDRRAPIR